MYCLQVEATDLDKGYNGQVRYSVVQQPNQIGSKFIVDEISGEVKTNKVAIFKIYFNLLYSIWC